VPKLQWLRNEQGCALPDDISFYAARSGSVDTLRWLRECGSSFNTETCKGAAASAQLHVLQFLYDEGCEWDKEACSAAAKHNHFSTLQWLHDQGCLWDEWAICGDAAEVGSMEMLLYLKQLDCEYHEDTMIGAAMRGQLAICQFLVAELCPSNAMACTAAAGAGHFEVVRFLHESGCP
jgi:hypothetical protein